MVRVVHERTGAVVHRADGDWRRRVRDLGCHSPASGRAVSFRRSASTNCGTAGAPLQGNYKRDVVTHPHLALVRRAVADPDAITGLGDDDPPLASPAEGTPATALIRPGVAETVHGQTACHKQSDPHKASEV